MFQYRTEATDSSASDFTKDLLKSNLKWEGTGDSCTIQMHIGSKPERCPKTGLHIQVEKDNKKLCKTDQGFVLNYIQCLNGIFGNDQNIPPGKSRCLVLLRTCCLEKEDPCNAVISNQ